MASATAAGRRYKRMARRRRKVEQREAARRVEALRVEQMERALVGSDDLMCLREGRDVHGYLHLCARPATHGGSHVSNNNFSWTR